MILNIENVKQAYKPASLPPRLTVSEAPTPSIHDVPPSWKFLKRATKDAIAMIDVEGMNRLLKCGAFPRFINAYDTLSQLYHEGMTLNDDQREVLLLPVKLWGRKAGYVLYEMRRTLYDEIQIQKDRKRQKAGE